MYNEQDKNAHDVPTQPVGQSVACTCDVLEVVCGLVESTLCNLPYISHQ